MLTPEAAAAAAKLLVWAARHCNMIAMRQLLASGADPNVQPSGCNGLVLHELIQHITPKGNNMVRVHASH
jgi:hypothetical protein